MIFSFESCIPIGLLARVLLCKRASFADYRQQPAQRVSVFEGEDEPKLMQTHYWEVMRETVVGHMNGLSMHLATLEVCV